jgi:hypothetical protein
MLKKSLIALGAVLALLIALVLVAGYWGGPSGPATETLSMTVGGRTLTVGGRYKNVTQQSTPDGIKVTVDGHEIALEADQLTVDGQTQVLEPGQDVEVDVKEDGKVETKIVQADAEGAGTKP